MSQNQGYLAFGRPCATGMGISSGSRGASLGNQSSSLPPGLVAPLRRASRTESSSPRRKIALTAPAGSTRRSGQSAHSGNCSATNRRTSGSSISSSSACIPAISENLRPETADRGAKTSISLRGSSTGSWCRLSLRIAVCPVRKIDQIRAARTSPFREPRETALLPPRSRVSGVCFRLVSACVSAGV